MSCAARARRLNDNAEIIVLERGEHVSFANCGLPYYVGGEIEHREALLVQTPQRLEESLNLDVRTHHDVTGLDPESRTVTVETPDGTIEINYDALVLSPGATAATPPLPELDSPRVHTLRTVPDAVTLREIAEDARSAIVPAPESSARDRRGAAYRAITTTLVEYGPQVLPTDSEHAWLVSGELRRLADVRTDTAARVLAGEGSDTGEL